MSQDTPPEPSAAPGSTPPDGPLPPLPPGYSAPEPPAEPPPPRPAGPPVAPGAMPAAPFPTAPQGPPTAPPAAPPTASPTPPPAAPPGAIPPQGPPTAPPPGYYAAQELGRQTAVTPGPAPAPGAFGAPPTGASGAPPPGGFQPAAVGYQYGSGVPSSANLATPGRRILGFIVDWFVLLIVYVPLVIALVAALASSSTTTTNQFGGTTTTESSFGLVGVLLVTAAIFGVQVVYHVAFVATKGQTPGAMLVKVKVVRLSDGQVPGWGPAFMRWLPNLVGLLCNLLTLGLYIWGLVNLFSNPLRQTPFDLAAKTVVIDVS